ncbi:MAG: hypothetical protein IPF94_15280 [Betaproteobacteria bacterium]|nr:hypothetical protein [Betaproteobacteria bacterium]
MIKLFGAPWTMLVNAVLLIGSTWILRGVAVSDDKPGPRNGFRRSATTCMPSRRGKHAAAGGAGGADGGLADVPLRWQVVVLVKPRARWACPSRPWARATWAWAWAPSAAAPGAAQQQRIGPGPCSKLLGYAVTGIGWPLPAGWHRRAAGGVAAFAAMMMLFTMGAVRFIFINFLALRQAATPKRRCWAAMTSTMRWLSLLMAPAGSLFGGGWANMSDGSSALAFAGIVSLLLAALAWQWP